LTADFFQQLHHRNQGIAHRRGANRAVNDVYNDAKVRIHVDVEGGIGQINLIAD
jgi:hypothetical protein